MSSVFNVARSPVLESFDPAGRDADPKNVAKPNADWQDGHAKGLVAGQALALATQSALTAEIAQSLADMGFGFAEARVQLLRGLKPLFGALINRVLPGLSEQALAVQVISLLQQAAERDSSAPLELSVNPTQTAGLAALLPYAVGMPVILVADPQVGSGQAVLRSNHTETFLDVGAVLAGVQATLSAIFEAADERANYG